jgi:hypothetical protein
MQTVIASSSVSVHVDGHGADLEVAVRGRRIDAITSRHSADQRDGLQM